MRPARRTKANGDDLGRPRKVGASPRVRLLVIASLLVVTATVRAQSVLDATLTTVNGDLILKSDVLWNLALDPQVKPEEFWSPRTQEMMLRTLVDQRLLLGEAARLPATQPTEEEVRRKRDEVASRFNSFDDTTRFERRMQLVGLTGPRLDAILRDWIRITKFVDFRFRSFVVVTEPEVVRYFEVEIKRTLPDQSEAAVREVFTAKRAEIEQVLTEEKINTAIEAFLDAARSRAEIVTLSTP